MTAAVVSTPQPGPANAGKHERVTAVGRAAAGVIERPPYLTAVPECEPPFDDESPPTGTVPAGLRGQVVAQRAVLAGEPANSVATSVRAHRQGLITRAAHAPPATLPHRGSAAPLTAPPITPADGRATTIAAVGIPSWSSESDIGVRKTATEHLPPADRTASVLARALVEVISGQRPLAQLRVHCAPEIYAGLAARPSAGPLALPHLLTVRVCEPADGVAEVSAAFRRADRVRAVAFRLQGVDGRWRITALQLG